MAKKEQSVDMPHQVLDPRRDFYGYPAGLGQTYENFYGADAFHATVNIFFKVTWVRNNRLRILSTPDLI